MAFYLQSVDRQKNRRRHYLVTLQHDLWGQLVVVKWWGRIGVPAWQGGQTIPVADLLEASKIIAQTLQRRRHHGYVLVGKQENG